MVKLQWVNLWVVRIRNNLMFSQFVIVGTGGIMEKNKECSTYIETPIKKLGGREIPDDISIHTYKWRCAA